VRTKKSTTGRRRHRAGLAVHQRRRYQKLAKRNPLKGRRRSCFDAFGRPKRTYGSLAEARETLETLPKLMRGRAYKCVICPGFHVSGGGRR
jgi:hypothetical protein